MEAGLDQQLLDLPRSKQVHIEPSFASPPETFLFRTTTSVADIPSNHANQAAAAWLKQLVHLG